MIFVFQFFRAAASIATHPGDVFGDSSGDIVAERRKEMSAIVQFALASLRSNSPIGASDDPHPGLYRDSHTLFVNGNDVADLSSWNPGDVIHISNPVPYARIIEIGDQRTRVPHNVYQLAEQATQQKFGDIARIEFNYMPVRFGGIDKWSRTASGRRLASRIRGGNPRLHAGWLVRQPTLIIKGLD